MNGFLTPPMEALQYYSITLLDTSSSSTLPSTDFSGGGGQSLHLSLLRNWSMSISSPQSTIPALVPYLLPRMTNKFHLEHRYPKLVVASIFQEEFQGYVSVHGEITDVYHEYGDWSGHRRGRHLSLLRDSFKYQGTCPCLLEEGCSSQYHLTTSLPLE